MLGQGAGSGGRYLWRHTPPIRQFTTLRYHGLRLAFMDESWSAPVRPSGPSPILPHTHDRPGEECRRVSTVTPGQGGQQLPAPHAPSSVTAHAGKHCFPQRSPPPVSETVPSFVVGLIPLALHQAPRFAAQLRQSANHQIASFQLPARPCADPRASTSLVTTRSSRGGKKEGTPTAAAPSYRPRGVRSSPSSSVVDLTS